MARFITGNCLIYIKDFIIQIINGGEKMLEIKDVSLSLGDKENHVEILKHKFYL